MGDIVPNQVFVAGYSRSRIIDTKDLKELFKEFNVSDVAYKGPFSFVVRVIFLKMEDIGERGDGGESNKVDEREGGSRADIEGGDRGQQEDEEKRAKAGR